MNEPLPKPELLDRLLAAIEAAGWQTLIVERSHPFLLRLFKREEQGFLNVRIYVWNCTSGGRNRPADEYRVQLTGVVPHAATGETTLLLGWHEGYGVFVGFDIRKHKGQASASPSIQVKEASLLNAHNHAFSAYERANGEIAVCFCPEFIVEYALNLAKLHGFTAKDQAEVEILKRRSRYSIRWMRLTKRRSWPRCATGSDERSSRASGEGTVSMIFAVESWRRIQQLALSVVCN